MEKDEGAREGSWINTPSKRMLSDVIIIFALKIPKSTSAGTFCNLVLGKRLVKRKNGVSLRTVG
jgi:hypothetical protein